MVHSSESQNRGTLSLLHSTPRSNFLQIESARSRLAELRGDNLDPGRFDSVKSALDMVEEMSALCARFPYGQNEAQQLCQRLIDSLLRGSPSCSFRCTRRWKPQTGAVPSNLLRHQTQSIQTRNTNHRPPEPPSYTNIDAFDSIVASRMLFEMWAKWSRNVWLSQEKHIWEQVQRLGRICVPRDQWEEQFRSDTSALNNTIPVPGLDDSEIFKLSGLDPLCQREIAKICLDQMDGLVALFPFAKETMSSVVGRLRINFSGSCTVKFVERERVLQRRFEAELDHRRKIDKAWSELDEMEKWIDSVFPLGKVRAAWL
ncbi:hypothetical protein B0H14DRAFT_2868074 [Mycena olivaceomarginata]|nr:hypothetical protein B0H14DRAFT_2868074 [Mycena olivaceomarginata]